jgi:hypothetical protein
VVAEKEEFPQPARPKCSPFVLLQNPAHVAKMRQVLYLLVDSLIS